MSTEPSVRRRPKRIFPVAAVFCLMAAFAFLLASEQAAAVPSSDEIVLTSMSSPTSSSATDFMSKKPKCVENWETCDPKTPTPGEPGPGSFEEIPPWCINMIGNNAGTGYWSGTLLYTCEVWRPGSNGDTVSVTCNSYNSSCEPPVITPGPK